MNFNQTIYIKKAVHRGAGPCNRYIFPRAIKIPIDFSHQRCRRTVHTATAACVSLFSVRIAVAHASERERAARFFFPRGVFSSNERASSERGCVTLARSTRQRGGDGRRAQSTAIRLEKRFRRRNERLERLRHTRARTRNRVLHCGLL